ncbi:MAG: type III polyketide synthase [Alphaproteobacteria bacterium]|nr:type III polyketide synthase [Alphaproteobacteria bacterium]
MALPPVHLQGLATALPPHRARQADVVAMARELFKARGGDFERFKPVYDNAGVQERHLAVPLDWYAHPHGWAETSQRYVDAGCGLLEQAARSALARSRLGVQDIDTIVTVSTTGIATPSLDAHLVNRLRLRRDVERLPIFGLGCAGGVVGLSRGIALARSRPGTRVLVLVVELCGLTFRLSDQSNANIVATALFGDGAAAAIVSTDADGPIFGPAGEYTWPDSLDVMGWRIEDDGFGVVFSRDIPVLVQTQLRSATETFLGVHGRTLADIDSFVCHPGGTKVVAALERAYGLPDNHLKHARAVLARAGNMSAATVLFVLESALEAGDGPRHMLTALGPGFTAAFLLMNSA